MAVERLTKEHWVKKLGLTPHPEGGYFAQTFKSETMITIPGKIEKPHSTATDIYYLMGNPAKGEFSSWHKLHNLEESWHHHYGSDVIIYMLDEKGNLTEHHLGLGENASLQVHVPASVWFCATVDSKSADDYALVGCTVQPGFEFEDFELADRAKLTQQFSQHKSIIEKYTRVEKTQEKKIDPDFVAKLTEDEIFQISLSALQGFDQKSSAPVSEFHTQVDNPNQALKRELQAILKDSTNTTKKTSMIKAIESANINLDLFSQILIQLKNTNHSKNQNATITQISQQLPSFSF